MYTYVRAREHFVSLMFCFVLFARCLSYRTYCMLGDGESAEGSNWEAFSFAGTYKLDNLVAILDINRLGQSDPTALQHSVDVYLARVNAFG